MVYKIIIIIIIGIQPLGRFGHGPDLSQSTGMALVRCILGKFLGVVCHCFPPCARYASQILTVRCLILHPEKLRISCLLVTVGG